MEAGGTLENPVSHRTKLYPGLKEVIRVKAKIFGIVSAIATMVAASCGLWRF